MSGSIRTALALLLILPVFGLPAPAAWAAEARLLTQADIDGMGGPVFQGGVGDYLLRNDRLDAVILAIGVTPDGVETTDSGLGSYFSNGLSPTGGILIDAMTPGDANDQLQTIVHNVNFSTAGGGSIYYRGSEAGPAFTDPELVGGPTASITVSGVVVFDDSSVENPTITATTTYSLTDGEAWIEISTTITNTTSEEVEIFTLGDENRHVRNQFTFQPFPDRGAYTPRGSFSNPTGSIGVFPWYPKAGLHDLAEALLDAVPPICYAFVAPSLAEPLIGFEYINRRNVASKKYDLTADPVPTLGAGSSLTFDRRFVVAPGGSVEDCADVVMPLLYEPVLGMDARATYQGRVVTPAGDPIARATLLFDQTSPGFDDDPELNDLTTGFDNNWDGTVDVSLTADAGKPVPATHVRTDADGRFTVRLQAVEDPAVEATVYEATVYAANRPPVDLPPMTVDAMTIATGVDLGDIVMAGTGTLEVTVTEAARGTASPAKIAIFGTGGTDDPDFGDQFWTRTRFDCAGLPDIPCLSQYDGDGGDTLDRCNTARMSEATRGFPAVNADAAHDGTFSLELAPGSYEVLASRGPEHSFDSALFTITEGQTTSVQMTLSRVVATTGWTSVDGHVHAAPSNDAGTPLTDRVVSMLAAGVDTIVATDHDHITDYAPRIAALGMDSEIASVIGAEASAESSVAVSDFTDGRDAFPNSIGHLLSWPLSRIEGARRRGVPTDEELVAATVIDRLRGMDSLPLLGATPDTATLDDWLAAIQAGQPGTPGENLPADEDIVVQAHPRAAGRSGPYNNFESIGYDPSLPVDEAPNDLANLRSNYHSDYVGAGGTSTRGLDVDAFELFSSIQIDVYLLSRDDWFSLLKQGIHRAAVAGSDTHRPVLDGAGYPRFYVPCDPCTEEQLVDHVRGLRVVGTSGPFIRFGVVANSLPADRPSPVAVGSTVTSTFPIVFLIVEVSAAPWIPVEEIRIFQNGEPAETIDIEPVLGGPVQRFSGLIPIAGVDADAFFVVEAGNEIDDNGDPVNPDTLELMRRLTTSDMVSLAFTNPIFVDRDGDGYQPPGLKSSSTPPRRWP